MSMAAYAARRTLFYVIVFFLVTMLVFFFIHAFIDHDTFVHYDLLRGESAGQRHLMFDKPIGVLYVQWLGDFFTGDWGTSLVR